MNTRATAGTMAPVSHRVQKMEERKLRWVTPVGHKTADSKYSHNLNVESYFVWGMFRTLSLETASQQLSENCSKEAGGAVRS